MRLVKLFSSNLVCPKIILRKYFFDENLLGEKKANYSSNRFYTQLCVNHVEVTVNTCTCTDVFTVITTKDQSGGMYNIAW